MSSTGTPSTSTTPFTKDILGNAAFVGTLTSVLIILSTLTNVEIEDQKLLINATEELRKIAKNMFEKLDKQTES